MSAAAAPSGLPERLGLILEGLRRLIALRAGQNHALVPMVVVLWGRLGRTLARVAAIVARHQAGTLRPPQPRAGRPQAPPQPPPPPQRPPVPPCDPLPRRRGWLVRHIRETVTYGEHLRLLLEDPETRALIEAAPQLRRLIRPLWRMLRRDPPPPLLSPPRPTPPRQAPAARAKRRQRKRRETSPPQPVAAAPQPAPRPAPAIRRIAGHAFNRG